MFDSDHLPLLQTCFTFPATEADIVGATSLVLWTMSLLVVVKYAWLVLPANDLGEGELTVYLTLKVQAAESN
jgi:KUP system potassium uptake protein